MQDESNRATIAADDVGIHFRHGREDVVVDWGEIAQICALRERYADGATFIEVFVDHLSGVDFRFQSVEVGYEQVTLEMEKHLIGFTRTTLEAVRTFDDEGQTIPVVWKRDESLQPYQLRPPIIDPRDPTPEEIAQMDAAHRASIATCEKILRRPLQPDELQCVYTGFENGRIVGSIRRPLSELLIERDKGSGEVRRG